MSIRSACAVLALVFAVAPAAAQEPPVVPPEPFRELATTGLTVFTPADVRELLDLKEGVPLPHAPESLAARLQRRYRRGGYTKAAVSAAFDPATGRLTLEADEGRIDAVAIEGVEEALASDLRGNLSVQPGALYNTREIARAVNRVLAPSQGAIELREFDLLDRDGLRTLIISLRRDTYDFDLAWGTHEREDWYNQVDGLNLAAGFRSTLFDQSRFNHTFLTGYVGYKFAREDAGYSFGLERPIFGGAGAPRLFFAAEVHDVTASDDFWRLSITEQSLVAFSFRNSFRDYYGARGYQASAIFQPNGFNELMLSWRSERHEPLVNEADFTLFRDDHAFRQNPDVADGRLQALVLGYTLDSRSHADESRAAAYRRHTGQRLFGEYAGSDSGVRLDVTSEIATAGLGGDFDFTRTIANLRGYLPLSPAQQLRARLLVGRSTGSPPPQRRFGLGGIGSVHGYAFKESIGEHLVLANVEYQIGSPRHARVIGFFDFGRVYQPVDPARDGWMRGLGVGLAVGDLRVDFGWRADDIPGSLQLLVRFGPTF
jgi:hypothetical protein